MIKNPAINSNLFVKMVVQITRICWVLAITLLVMAAIFVSVSRHFVPLLVPNYKKELETQLSLALQAPVQIAEIDGAVVGFNPEIILNNIQIGKETTINKLSIELAVVNSVMARQLRLQDVTAVGVQARLTQVNDGWQLGDVFFPSQTHQDFSWVAMLSQIQINDSNFTITLKNRNEFSINKIGLVLNQFGKRQRIISNLTMPNKKQATLIAEGKGAWSDVNEMTWDVYAQFPDMDWLPWLQGKTADYITVKKMQGSGQAWFQWRDGRVDDARVKLELPSLAWQYVSNGINSRATTMQVEIIFQKRDDKTIVSIPVLSFMQGEQLVQLGGWSLIKKQADDHRDILLLEADKLHVDSFVRLSLASQLLPIKAQEALKELNPRGEFHQLKGIVYLNNQHELIDLKIMGQLKNISLDAWDGSPKVSGVDGDIIFNKMGGHFALNSERFVMEFPDLFAQGWQYQSAKGDLYWLYDDEKFVIRSGLLNINNDVGNLFGRFDFTSPHDVSEPDHLGLILSFKDVDAAHRMQYIPTKAMDKALNKWLARAIVKGRIVQGVYIYDGGVTQAVKDDETQQVVLDIKDVDIKFDEAWPVLERVSGTFIYSNDGMQVYSESAKLLNAEIKNINVNLPANDSILRTNGQVNTSLQTTMELLRTTPLHQKIGSGLDNWQVDGLVTANLSLGIPLGNQKTQVDVRGFVKNSTLKIPDVNLTFTDVNGDVNYSSALGLSSKKLTATTFNMPVNISVVTLAKDPSLTARIRTQGNIAIDTILGWQPSPLWAYIKGTLPFDLELQVPLAAPKPLILNVNSSLQNINILLPKPYGKTLKDNRALKTSITFNNDHYRIDASLNNEDVRGIFVIGKNKEPLKANIYLGSTTTVSDPISDGLSVIGSTSSVAVDEWLDFFETQKKSSTVDANALGIKVDIRADTLHVFDQSIKNAQLSVDRKNLAWRFGVDSEIISGSVALPDNQQLPYDVSLKHIKLPKTETSTAVTTASSTAATVATTATRRDPLAGINPNELPAMQIKVDDFRIGDEQYGKWYFTVNPIHNGVDIQNIQIDNMKYFSVAGEEVRWTQDKTQNQSQTYFKGTATTTDLNTALKAWGNETGIISEKARFDADMTWPGSPAMFSTVDGSGSMKFKFTKGSIVDVSGKTNVLKVFGLMNLSALTNRLSGEFSDLFSSGISYDKMEGHVNLQDGVATFVEPMTISGPSSDFKLSGTANFKTGEIDQEVIVTPPVGQNAAVIATVLCGPACGAIAYATNWVLGSGIRKFTSLKYKMTGSFSNPEVDKETILEKITHTPSPQP